MIFSKGGAAISETISKLNDLTIILPLKDRAFETKSFMQHSIISGVNYLILDGSTDDQNEEIVRGGLNAQIEYRRLEPDLDINTYVRKMAEGTKSVKTPYVMMADNDDVLLEGGLIAAIHTLRSNYESVFAGGDVIGFLRSIRKPHRVSWPKTNVNASHLDGMEGLVAINQSRFDWRHVWYSVFRTEVLAWCWEVIVNSPVRDPYLIEFLICDLPFCKGQYSYTGFPQYMRLQNQPDRAIATLGFRSVETGRQPRSWWLESELADEVLASHLNVDVSELDPQFIRAAAVAGLQATSSRPWALIQDLAVGAGDRVKWLSMKSAIKLTSSGRYNAIPLRDRSGRSPLSAS
jgi:glycosyltransferase domain-containing protein